MSHRAHIAGFAIASWLAAVPMLAVAEESTNWPRFRGPLGTGISDESGLPAEWDAKSVEWVTELPAQGHSSPITWNDSIFLTGVTESGDAVERRVVRLDRKTGKVIWNELAAKGEGEQLHKMNSWATPSCATDGRFVVAFFGVGGLHCFDFEGNKIWSRQLGDFPGAWGVGASPIILGDRVIQNCDATGKSFLLAVDIKSGKDIWRTPRREKPRGGWSTPVVIEVAGRQELLLNGETRIESYNPESGKPYWFCQSFNGRGTPSPAWGNGLAYVVNGKSGDVYAVKPGGEGDITESRMAWHTPRKGGRDLPSPIFLDGSLFVTNMAGIATSYDGKTGEEQWQERLGGKFSSSPIAVKGRIYATAENGDVFVIRSGPKFELIAKNSVGAGDDETFRSSLAVSRGQLLLRSDKRLYCIGQPVGR
jgi:outer membrane protein assembly factor BamB